MTVSRRGFLSCLAGLVAAPMIVKIDSIMPVKAAKLDWPLDNFPHIEFNIERFTVTAKSRELKATWTMELEQDLKAVYGIDAETELRSILQKEIDNKVIKIICDSALSPTYDPNFISQLERHYAAGTISRSYFKEVLLPVRFPVDSETLGSVVFCKGTR